MMIYHSVNPYPNTVPPGTGTLRTSNDIASMLMWVGLCEREWSHDVRFPPEEKELVPGYLPTAPLRNVTLGGGHVLLLLVVPVV